MMQFLLNVGFTEKFDIRKLTFANSFESLNDFKHY